MKNKRLDAMIARVPEFVNRGGQFPVWVDCFMGRCFYQDIAPTIRTRTDGANMDFIMEKVKVINPLKGQSDNGWHFEQQVYDAEGIARAVKAGEGSGNIPKVIEVGKVKEGKHQQDFVQHEEGICRCICTGSHASTPHLLKTMVSEPISVAMRGRNPDNPSERGKSNGKYKQRLEMNESGVANTITSVQKDSMVAEPQVLTPKRTEFGKAVRKQYESGELNMSRHDMTTMGPRTDGISNTLTSVQKDNYLCIPEATKQGYTEAHEGDSVNLAVPNSKTRRGRVGKQMANTLDTGCQQGVVEKDIHYRIRKLTPRECFRLMGVDDAAIDKIQASGISNSQQYKLAGNSIVVDVLYHLFRKMFCETENENDQLTLF